ASEDDIRKHPPHRAAQARGSARSECFPAPIRVLGRGLQRASGVTHSIPLVDVAPLLHGAPQALQAADRALAAAARDIGFVCIRGLPGEAAPSPAERARLLAIFGLDATAKRRLYRRKFAAENLNAYRGWFPLQPGNLTSK